MAYGSGVDHRGGNACYDRHGYDQLLENTGYGSVRTSEDSRLSFNAAWLVKGVGDMNEQTLPLLRSRISAILPEVKALRRKIHSEPEIGLETWNTAYKIRESLQSTSLQFWEPLLGGDVIVELKNESDTTICLRADIDALPIQEETLLSYQSIFSGRMHACGHDGHAAMLVGAAKVLDSLRHDLHVNVRFVFQPGEEVICAGKTLVERGAVDGCDAAFAIHGWPGLPAGTVMSREGPLMAAGSLFVLKITGKGCHGAKPEEGNNPIPVAARIACELTALHGMVHSENGGIVSVCSIQAGSNTNVIPDTAIIRGTARYLSTEAGDRVEEEIRRIVENACHESGVSVEIEYDRSYNVPVINSKAAYALVRELVEKYLPTGRWFDAQKSSMGMEDFAYYLQGREGALLDLGLGETAPGLHASSFDFNDEVLETGILMHCLLALSWTKQ